MTEKGKQVKFKIGDRVVDLKSGNKGTIAWLGAHEQVVHVRWDGDRSWKMVEVSTLRKDE